MASLTEVASQLRLVPLGRNVGLLFLRSGEGPAARNFQIMASAYDGTQRSAVQTLNASAALLGFEAGGTPAPAPWPVSFAYVDETNRLWVGSRDGQQVSAPVYDYTRYKEAVSVTYRVTAASQAVGGPWLESSAASHLKSAKPRPTNSGASPCPSRRRCRNST